MKRISKFYRNSEANVFELLENLEEMLMIIKYSNLVKDVYIILNMYDIYKNMVFMQSKNE